ncbi:MAG: hypothetical protein ACD_62C00025G0001 [uncultured bacterium]|nr:MAG: hypothetical protein ACD_62C00025G0001 [uncultured bacterium]
MKIECDEMIYHALYARVALRIAQLERLMGPVHTKPQSHGVCGFGGCVHHTHTARPHEIVAKHLGIDRPGR